MTAESCRDNELKTKLSKINALPFRYTTKSDPISRLTNRLDHEPEEKNTPGTPEVRVVAGHQHNVLGALVNGKILQILQIFACGRHPSGGPSETIPPGSARVPRVGFGVSPKQSLGCDSLHVLQLCRHPSNAPRYAGDGSSRFRSRLGFGRNYRPFMMKSAG